MNTAHTLPVIQVIHTTTPSLMLTERYIMQTRVVTGEGNSAYKAAPYKNPVIQYDSVVNNDPSMFIVFHDAVVYPEYIIKLR